MLPSRFKAMLRLEPESSWAVLLDSVPAPKSNLLSYKKKEKVLPSVNILQHTNSILYCFLRYCPKFSDESLKCHPSPEGLLVFPFFHLECSIFRRCYLCQKVI